MKVFYNLLILFLFPIVGFSSNENLGEKEIFEEWLKTNNIEQKTEEGENIIVQIKGSISSALKIGDAISIPKGAKIEFFTIDKNFEFIKEIEFRGHKEEDDFTLAEGLTIQPKSIKKIKLDRKDGKIYLKKCQGYKDILNKKEFFDLLLFKNFLFNVKNENSLVGKMYIQEYECDLDNKLEIYITTYRGFVEDNSAVKKIAEIENISNNVIKKLDEVCTLKCYEKYFTVNFGVGPQKEDYLNNTSNIDISKFGSLFFYKDNKKICGFGKRWSDSMFLNETSELKDLFPILNRAENEKICSSSLNTIFFSIDGKSIVKINSRVEIEGEKKLSESIIFHLDIKERDVILSEDGKFIKGIFSCFDPMLCLGKDCFLGEKESKKMYLQRGDYRFPIFFREGYYYEGKEEKKLEKFEQEVDGDICIFFTNENPGNVVENDSKKLIKKNEKESNEFDDKKLDSKNKSNLSLAKGSLNSIISNDKVPQQKKVPLYKEKSDKNSEVKSDKDPEKSHCNICGCCPKKENCGG